MLSQYHWNCYWNRHHTQAQGTDERKSFGRCWMSGKTTLQQKVATFVLREKGLGTWKMKMDVTEAKVPCKHFFGHLLPFYPEAITLLSFWHKLRLFTFIYSEELCVHKREKPPRLGEWRDIDRYSLMSLNEFRGSNLFKVLDTFRKK